MKKPIAKVRPGDVVYVDRGLYKHYGVYIENGCVADFSPTTGSDALGNKHNAIVHEKSVDEFLDGCPGRVDNSPGLHSRKQTLKRAKSAIGTGYGSYNLVFNNCEHKAREWQTGEWKSKQVEDAIEIAVNTIEKAIKFFKK
jgi:hypothetical protein